MRKTVSLGVIISLISCLLFSVTASATTVNDYNRTIEYLDNGDYIETIISDDETDSEISLFSTKSITKTKTSYFKNTIGTVLWSVAIKATFSYNGKSATCTSCSHITTAPASNWSIKSASHSKSGNTATAKATATYKKSSGSSDYFRSVTIKCSPTGVVS